LTSRSTRFSFKLALSALAVVASAAIGVACSVETTSSQSETSSPNALDDQGTTTGAPPLPTTDASVAEPALYRGNPLCRVTDSCMPDDDGSRRTSGTPECAAPASDAAPNEDAKACRVGRENGVITSTCKQGGAGLGTDGVTCEGGADCAAGFDCVADEKGVKACRHYCCTGTCKDLPSQNGSATFCDVQALVDVNHKAPVCMPIKRCTLLSTGECSANESCSVVTETGETGCVTIGDKQVGASCDEDHCAAKLTCLGQPGSRKCFKLCKVNASDCGPSLVCTTSTVFKDPDFGICQKP
jgi:hypothetical protein